MGAGLGAEPGEPNPPKPLPAAGWGGALNASNAVGAGLGAEPGEPNPPKPLPAAGWGEALNASNPLDCACFGALLLKASKPADGAEAVPPNPSNAEAGATG